ncbi:uncharacterized protein LOC142246478 [Anomaloglossus baeobatrachus]|uniref:uncharacterized protein LOC142246478 n=1 Tax=Anomaloglossus baeobatrachus TaxID=238106 RepID=UPI003F4F60FA
MDLMKKCVLLLLLHHTGAALEVSAPTRHVVTMGSVNVIPCEYTVEKPPVKPEFLAVFWLFQEKEILRFDNEVRTNDSRYSLDTKKAIQGRVDLSVSDISLSDAGVYTCKVLYSPEEKEMDITLVVKALPRVTIIDRSVAVNVESVLRCSAAGFYPAEINIKWFRGSERLSDVTEDPPLRNQNGLYSVNSTVTITPTEEDREQIISCRVQHESLQEPLQEDFRLTYTDKSATSENETLNIILGVVGALVGILVIIGISTGIYKYKNKKRLNNEGNHSGTCQNTSDSSGGPAAELKIGKITVPDLILNNRATLECPIYNPKLGKHTVHWYEKKQDTEEATASDHRRLQTTEPKGENTWIAYLTLTPVTRADDNITYICKVKGSQQTVEASASTGDLHVIEPESLPDNKNRKSAKSPGKNTSLKTTDPSIEEYDQRPTVTPSKERNPPALKTLDKGGLPAVNKSIPEIGKRKNAPLLHKKSGEQEAMELRERDDHKNTPRPKNGNSQDLCPGNELLNKEKMEEHSPPTDKTGHEKKTHPAEESCAKKEEEVNEEIENEGTSYLISDSFTEQENNASMGRSTREDEEKMSKKKREENDKTSPLIHSGAASNKEGSETEEISKEMRPETSEGRLLEDSEGGASEDSDNDETSPLKHTGVSSTKEGAETEEISKEGRMENNEGRPLEDIEGGAPDDSDNDEASTLIPNEVSSNNKVVETEDL